MGAGEDLSPREDGATIQALQLTSIVTAIV